MDCLPYILHQNQQVKSRHKVKRWRKWIQLGDARLLSELFCNHFGLTYCEVYYVDVLGESTYGQYFSQGPHILMLQKLLNPMGILIHELTHHLEYCDYDNENDTTHGYAYQKAKHRVVRWAKKHISDKPNWYIPLRATQPDIAMRQFRV